jgi:hypothetical protein
METGMLLESVFSNSNKNTVYINKKDSENNLMVSWPTTPYGIKKGVLRLSSSQYIIGKYRKIYDISNIAGDSRVPQIR